MNPTPDRLLARHWLPPAVLSLAVLSALLTSWWAWTQFDRQIGASYAAYERVEAKEQRLIEIHRAFGYGGFIHNFKNFLLRGETDLLDRLDTQGQALQASISAYRDLDAGAAEQAALSQLRATLDAYRAKIPELVIGRRAGQAIAALDRQVRIDDGPALDALRELTRIMVEERARNGELLGQIQRAGRGLLWNLDGVVVLLLLAGALTLALTRSLGRALARERETGRHLREQRDLTQAILDATADVVITIDQHGKIHQVNRMAESMIGYPPEELLGANIARLMPPNVGDQHHHYIGAYLAGGPAKVIGRRRIMGVRHRDGHYFPAELSISPVKIQGEVFFTGLLRNVSEREAFERQLNTRRALFEGIFSESPDALILVDNQCRVHRANPAFFALFGHPREEVLGQPATRFHAHPALDGRGDCTRRCFLEPGPPAPFTLDYRTRDGRIFPGETLTAKLAAIDAEGNPGCLVSIRDISETQALTQALAEREAEARRLARVATQTSHAVLITNARGETEWINAGFTRISGYSLDELRGRRPGALLQGPKTDPSSVRRLSEAVRAGRGLEVELINYHKNGTPYWVQIDMQPVRGKDGRLESFIAIEKDVTAQRQAEQGLRDFKTTLDLTSDCIFIFDPDSLRFTYVNQGASAQIGYPTQQLLEMHPFDIEPDFDETLFRALLVPLERGELTELFFETRHRHRDGYDIPVEISLQYLAPEEQRPHFVAMVRDITKRKEAEYRLDRHRRNLEIMNAIGGRAERDLDARLRAALGLAAQYLELEIGIVSRIAGQDYFVEYQMAPSDVALSDGQRFDLGQTYCEIALRQNDLVAIDVAGESAHRQHPCYRLMHLESYIGVPLWLPSDGTCYGTVNFSARRPRAHPFNPSDHDFLRLFARWVGATLDTHLAQEALRRSEERMQRSQTFANIGTWDWNIQTGELYWSERIAPLFGYARGEVETTYENFLEAIHPADRETVVAAMNACVERGEDYDIEHRVVWPDGKIRWLHERGDVVRARDGTPLQMLGVVQDITERHLAQQALLAAKEATEEAHQLAERFQRIVETTDQGVGIVSMDGTLIYVNPAHCRLFRCREEQLVGAQWESFFNETAREANAAIQASLEQGQGWEGLLPTRTPSGHEFTQRAHIGLVRDAAGTPRLIFNIFEDYSHELKHERELLAAKEAAEQANQAKSAFLSRMSHELRTPLNSILGFAQLLAGSRRAPLAERQREQVRHIEESGRHLLALINEILDLARIESGRLSLSLENIALDEVLTEVLDLLHNQAKARAIAMHREPTGDDSPPLLLRADRLRLKQILLNLLSNAIHYNRDQGQVRIAARPLDRDWVRIEVLDTGPGIAPDRLGAVFEPFNRLDADRTTIEGTGIGLTLTRELVEQMQGRIGVSSKLGQGSLFWVELPNAARATQTVTEIALASSVSTGHLRGSLLYIEDNPANRDLIAYMIREFPGIQLLTAPDAEQGLDLAEREGPDLILLDINLPDIDGLTALGRLRATPKLAKTPVIVLSADVTAATQERARAAGCQHFLAKPFDLDALLQVLRDYLES